MAVRIIKKSWWVDLTSDYIRYRKRSPENSKAGAEAYEVVLRQRLARGESIHGVEREAQQKQTFEEFASQWFEYYVRSNNKPLEQRAKKYILQSVLIPFFGKLPIEEITTRHIEEFKAMCLSDGKSRKTVNNRLAVFSKCLATAYEWLKIPGMPPKVTWLKCPPPKTDFLSLDECALVLSNSDGMVHEMILLALRSGMRHGEITGLQWSSIDWENRIITVRHTWCDRTQSLGSPKSNRERPIPIGVDVYEMLFKRKRSTGYVFLRKGKPWGSNPFDKALRLVRYKVGLRPFTWHTLRHTFASHLAKNQPLHVVQALLGHSTIGTTMRYAHVAPSMLRDAIDSLNPKQAYSSGFGQPMGNQWLTTQQVNSTKPL